MSTKIALENLTDDGLFAFVLRHYNTVQCLNPTDFVSELESDLSHVTHIKRLLLKHRRGQPLAVHLLLNHVILLKNVLGAVPATKVILLKLEQSFWEIIVPFFHFLSMCPHSVVIRGASFPLDKYWDTDVSRSILSELNSIGR